MTIHLRRTTPADIPFVCEVENAPENTPFIIPWSEDRHHNALGDPDILHMIAEKKETGHPVGYVIIAGLTNPHQSIELMRITIAVKGEGYGRNILRQIKHWAFIEQKAHRLWLDVKETNDRARSLYLSEGFHIEGILRDCLKSGDTYESLIILSMLATEYDAPKGQMRPES
ncbi:MULTISPECIES: GNAT family N-acetyltransferase [Brevibacillus]|uniref:GNAT family N-acetyltransferase n=1 Tax=Brevibacillus TaxID=55080 RepID=UPI00363FECA1